MASADWLAGTSPAFRLLAATSWLAPESRREQQDVAIREAIEATPDWADYLRLVDRHRTPALSWAALGRVPGIAIPDQAKNELKKRSDACRIEAIKQCMLLAEVLRGFNRAAIPIMTMKGVILSHELYGDVGLRQSRDLDLAVKREDLQRAQSCLEEMGWRLDSSIWFPLTDRQWESFLRHEHHLDFVHARTNLLLELHWRNQWETPDLTNARWTRSVHTVWEGCSLQAMNPGDSTLYLCSHGGDHAWSRVKWLGDLARAHTVGQLDWETAMDEARKTGQEAVLLAGLGLLKLLYGLPMPEFARERSKDLPPLVLETPLEVLVDPQDHSDPASPGSFSHRIRMSRYERSLRPRMPVWDSFSQLLYCREDFRDIPLPDAFFWAYLPIRPILLAWRLGRRLYWQIRKH